MLLLLVVFLVVNGKRGCDAERSERLVERGLSQAKQAQILELHNTHRNDVALGRKKNWNKREEKAAMMYYLKYDPRLAQLAQECADGCPKNIMQDCQIPLMNGFAFYEGDVINGGADWHAAMVFRSMIFERDQARQIEEGGVTSFGCGHSQVDRKSVRTEVVVCYYNKKVQRNGDVYKLGLPGNSCPHGLKKGFLGLCRHSPMDLSVQSLSTLNTSIQKAKTDFQILTSQNRSMISQMKNDNTQFGDQLVNQKQKNSATETQLQLQVIKLQEDCAVLAQKIELEQKKKKDLDEIVSSMKTENRKTVPSDKSKSVAELMKEQKGIKEDELPESIKSVKDHAERLRLIHLEHSKIENQNSDAELPTVQKGIKDHELKLQQIHIQHNEALAQIQEEKEFLNLARRERVIYSTVFKGIEKDAIVKAKELQNSIRQSEILKEEFRMLSEQLQLIQEKANKEQNEFQKQYESLFKEDHNASQIPFITEPNDDKLPMKILQQLSTQPAQPIDTTQKDQQTGSQPSDAQKDDKAPKKLLSQSSLLINPIIDTAQKVQEYESAFNKLYSETGLNSVENILAQYFNQEKQIDKIFVQINEINQEVDQTVSEIDSIEVKLHKYKSMNKVPIKEDIQLDDTRAEKLQKGINRTLRNLEYTKSDFIEIQNVLGIELIKQDDDERVFLTKVEQLDEIINDLLAVATLAEGKKIKQKPTSRLADYKRPESGETVLSPVKKLEVEKQEEEEQPDEDPELGSMLTEVAKKKIIAESRHTRDELQKEGRDLMLHNMQRKQQSKRSKAQQ